MFKIASFRLSRLKTKLIKLIGVKIVKILKFDKTV